MNEFGELTRGQLQSNPRTSWGLVRRLSPNSPAALLFKFLTIFRVTALAPFVVDAQPRSLSVGLAIFIIWDVIDGVVARKFTVDFPQRRMLDAYCDRVGIILVVAVAALSHNAWVWLLVLVLVDDFILWVRLQNLFRSRGVCALGGTPNRASALLAATWAMLFIWTGVSDASISAAIAFLVANIIVGHNMIRVAQTFRCDPPRVVVINNVVPSLWVRRI